MADKRYINTKRVNATLAQMDLAKNFNLGSYLLDPQNIFPDYLESSEPLNCRCGIPPCKIPLQRVPFVEPKVTHNTAIFRRYAQLLSGKHFFGGEHLAYSWKIYDAENRSVVLHCSRHCPLALVNIANSYITQ